MKVPAIKLFGKEISVKENSSRDKKVNKKGDQELENDKDSQQGNSLLSTDAEEDDTQHNPKDDPKTPPIIEEHENEKLPDNGNENTSSDQKTLKKPDKIIPCPRCNSMDTKFCYFNNYNVNQPRHFCKGCQRYWTAGGTMRSVPIGAGRRKNKTPAPHSRQNMITESIQMVHNMEIANKVISFGPGSALCKNLPNGVIRNGISSDCSNPSSVITTLNSTEGGLTKFPTSSGFTTQVPTLQGYPWPYSAVPNPGFCQPGYAIPVFPVAYLNCSVPGPWPVAWVPPPSGTNQISSNPTPKSPLGKHSRKGELLDGNNPEKEAFKEPMPILIPKTLRIDDLDDAAKSSIWETLGIKSDSTNRKGLFKGFESNGDEKKNHEPETPSSIKANPAAMSRSLNFQELVKMKYPRQDIV